MRYVSTRGQTAALGFSDVLLAGLAGDGGLYLPESWPAFSPAELASFAGRPYAEVASAVVARFAGGEIAEDDIARMTAEAYAGFAHPAVAPLVQLAPGHFLLELFHGPTLAFKDVAMQLLARLMDHALAARGRRATIVGATSGDTGAAAIEAFRGRAAVDVVILFPHGRVSDVQRRQMTTVMDANVAAVAIDGTFDDAQAIVKGLFADRRLREAIGLAGVNSINWARIVAQVVYYVTAAVALGAPHRPVSFTVPTGNFGDVFAGYVAKRMGVPIDRLVVATNVNDILVRALEGGRYEVRGVAATQSPSMDIQVSSNFERLLFCAGGGDAEAVRRMMAGLAQGGAFTIPEATLAAIRAEFDAGRTDEAGTRAAIAATCRRTGLVVDPHTAVALAVAESHLSAPVPMVTLATAHPAKFPDAVAAATGIVPALPPHLADLGDRPERAVRLPADLAAVAGFVERRVGALRAEA